MRSIIMTWFQDRNFGFIKNPDGTGRNIFFHKNNLRFPQSLDKPKGEEVEFELVEDDDERLSASDLVLVNRPAIKLEPYARDVRYNGTVRFFNEEWGYISCGEHDDIRYNFDNVLGSRKLKKGEPVTFKVSVSGEHHNAVQVASVRQSIQSEPANSWVRPKRQTPTQPATTCQKAETQKSPRPRFREHYEDRRDYPASKRRKTEQNST